MENTENQSNKTSGPYYDVTGLDLCQLVQIAVWGVREEKMGLLAHMAPFMSAISKEEATWYIIKPPFKIPPDKYGRKKIIDGDYIKGYACNLQIYECNERMLLPASWYDNSNNTVHTLCEEWGLDKNKKVGIIKEIKIQNLILWKRKKTEINIMSWNEIQSLDDNYLHNSNEPHIAYDKCDKIQQ